MKKNFFGKLFRNALVLLIVLLCIYSFINSTFFNIDKIYYTGLNQITVAEMKDLSNIKLGSNIFKINSRFYGKDFAIHPMVKQAEIIKHFPRQIEVKITERVAWAVIPYQDKFFFIDDEGVCIDQAVKLQQLDYPLVTLDALPERIYLGQTVQAQGIDVVRQVWDQLSVTARQNISDFHYLSKQQEIIIYTNRGTEVKFGNLERIEEKAAFLTQLVKMEDDLHNEGQEVLQYVDLRFDGQPVIKMID
ncbi:MAG TPA: FtsQ-type POTRA domain-containing protein [Syntrophomonadaceae bacterium]|nr:FtsQ-type POTRA domain-containing protein [Syntrophomonadaceae bacterium]HPR93098.1 FtsQ-type POTRA domain-containing protein [Syntrophomonadaceae bacterium]